MQEVAVSSCLLGSLYRRSQKRMMQGVEEVGRRRV